MEITIVGGGNIGTQFAVHCAEKGHGVRVYTSQPELFKRRLKTVDEEGSVTHEGDILLATNDPEIAFRGADIIIVTLPSMMMKDIAGIIYEHTDRSAMIGVVPGNGGSECAFYKSIERGGTFFGIERVPAIARLIKKGDTVRSVGYRKELHVSAIPAGRAAEISNIIEGIFDIPCKTISSYLNLTMTPSNPILHTTRLRTIFGDYVAGKTYESLPLFYEEWDDASSELLFACDEEVQAICRALPQFELENVVSLRVHYESPTIEAMTKKISSIPAFKGLKTPAVEIGGRYAPDLHSRYFTADFSYGLRIIKQIADFAGVKVPNIDEVLDWYSAISIEKDEFRFADYGITDLPSFERFYLR